MRRKTALLEAEQTARQSRSILRLWPVLVALGELYLRQLERQTEANVLFAEAKSIVEKMAATLDDPALQASFLAQPSIHKLLKQTEL